MVSVIYTVGWIIVANLGYLWLVKSEKNNPQYDYTLAGLFIVGAALLWPIVIPILAIRYLIKKFK